MNYRSLLNCLLMLLLLFGFSQFVTANQRNATTLISLALDGSAGAGNSASPVVSDDGRYIAYSSDAPDIVPNDTNGRSDVFVFDTESGDTVRVSVGTDGSESNDDSRFPDISADGRFVVFASRATNLAPHDTNFSFDIFLHDRDSNVNGIFDEAGGIATHIVSVSSDGGIGQFGAALPAISADGSTVAFSSESRLTPNDNNAADDVFVRDWQAGVTERVSVASDGAEGNAPSGNVTEGALDLSADGRIVAFASVASNLVPDDNNQCFGASCSDVFVHDRDSGITERVSVSSSGVEGDDLSYDAQISDDGRYLTFASKASTLVSNATLQCFGQNCTDVFLHDRQTDSTIRISQTADGSPNDGNSAHARMTPSADVIVFSSFSSTQLDGNCAGTTCVFVYDRATQLVMRVSLAVDGNVPNDGSGYPDVSADGMFVVYDSLADDIVPNDDNEAVDVFLHVRDTLSYAETIETYRRIRDEILTRSPHGLRYRQLFNDHTAELVQLIIANPDLYDAARETLLLWEPNMLALLDEQQRGTATISAEQITALDNFLIAVETEGSASLAADIAAERAVLPSLNDFVGLTMDDAAAIVLGTAHNLYLPITMRSGQTSVTDAPRQVSGNPCFVECALSNCTD